MCSVDSLCSKVVVSGSGGRIRIVLLLELTLGAAVDRCRVPFLGVKLLPVIVPASRQCPSLLAGHPL